MGLLRVPALLVLVLMMLDLPPAHGNCGIPGRLQFALMTDKFESQKRFPEGSEVEYTCLPGYQRNFNLSPTRTCLPSGKWSEATEFCQKKRCPTLEELTNGHINIKEDTVFGSIVSFSCNQGFLLIGPSQSQCEIVDENRVDWSEPLPECLAIKCAPPPNVDNGQHTGATQELFTFGSSVRYTCDKTYSLIGSEYIHCTTKNMRDGEWSDPPPECKVVHCESPSLQDGYLLSPRRPSYTYKETVMLECNSGFYMVGEKTISCGAFSSWVPGIPQCKPGVTSTERITSTTTSSSSSTSEKENQPFPIIPVITLMIFTQL